MEVMRNKVEVRDISDDVGCGLFTTSDIASSSVLLREPPMVFAQAYASVQHRPWRSTSRQSGHDHDDHHDDGDDEGRLRCCIGCGVPLPITPTEAGEELHRQNFVLHVDVCGQPHVAYFCSTACASTSTWSDGKRFVLAPRVVGTSLEEMMFPGTWTIDGASSSSSPTTSLRYPRHALLLGGGDVWDSYTATQRCDVWPHKLAVLSTLHNISMRYNERLWLITLLLAKLLHRAAMAYTVHRTVDDVDDDDDDHVDDHHHRRAPFQKLGVLLHAEIQVCVNDYAEGAPLHLRVEQRAFLRFAWRVLLWWLLICIGEVLRGDDSSSSSSSNNNTSWLMCQCQEEEDELGWMFSQLQAEVLPLQLLQQLFALTNANCHEYVVQHSVTSCTRSGDAAVACGTSSSSSSSSYVACAYGVALFDVATKLNHSCTPNVEVQRCVGSCVEAKLVALKSISANEECFISYVDLHTMEDDATRRRWLWEHYGFWCTCSRCASSSSSSSSPTPPSTTT